MSQKRNETVCDFKTNENKTILIECSKSSVKKEVYI